MADVKVSLTLLIPGSKRYSKQLCFKNSEIVDKKGRKTIVEEPIPGMTDEHHLVVQHFDKKTKKHFHAHYRFHTRKCIPAEKVINLTQDAFDYMTSAGCPAWFRIREDKKKPQDVWRDLEPEQRLEFHLHRIAEAENAIVKSYQILED